MSDEETPRPSYATGGYATGGCFIPLNPPVTPETLIQTLAEMNGCIVGRHRWAWLNAGGMECYDCGRRRK